MSYSKETELSNYIWDLKNKEREFKITWSILKHAKSYVSGARRCSLCLEEKLSILEADEKNLLTKRPELFSKCRHQNKFILRNLKPTVTRRLRHLPISQVLKGIVILEPDQLSEDSPLT